MAANLQIVGALAQVVGVMDGPAREPQHLLLELRQDAKLLGGRLSVFGHRHGSALARDTRVLMPCRSQKRARRRTRSRRARARAALGGTRRADRPSWARVSA